MKPKTKSKNYKEIVINLIQKKIHFFLIGLTVIVFFFMAVYIFFPKKIFINRKRKEKISPTVAAKIFPKTYTTKEGDFLWQIAEDNYGSGLNSYDIAQANKLPDPNDIPPGTKLTLPDVTPKKPTKGETSSIQSGQVTYKADKYTVQLGDSLSIIAFKAYGDYNAWPTIARANSLANPEAIEVGMVLVIPR